jgi:hypothetical protein
MNLEIILHFYGQAFFNENFNKKFEKEDDHCFAMLHHHR